MKKGLFIAFEGIDGSGITTHSKLTVNKLNEIGFEAIYTKEPTEGPVGKVLRALLRDSERSDPRLLAMLFAADRLWHCYYDPTLPGSSGIKGALDLGYIVVSDRYMFSNLAYQGKDVGYDWVKSLNKWALKPDILVYLNVDINIAIRRIKSRKRREIYEKEDILKLVSKSFNEVLRIARDMNIKVITVNEVVDSRELSVEETNDLIVKEIRNLLESAQRW